MVYLIGAGCGDIKLLTLKGKEILEHANCIIYDRLIDPEMLEFAPKNCEKIYVGKENHHHTLKQDQIIELLIQKAKEYEIVVRLKGGDCYVFGRGGEEGIALYDEKIPFEVIPGIPSFIGGLAYAGIPITHRGIASGIRIVTAHGKDGQKVDIDYTSLSKTDDTCIFMMGLSQLENIVTSLLNNGKDKNTKIALIQNGTFLNQKVLYSTLENVLSDFNSDPLQSPCLIVVGNVVSLHEILDFISRKKVIAFPRVSKEESGLSVQLRLHGYQVNEYAVGDLVLNEEVFPDLSNYTHLLFSSKFGVQCFFKQCQKNRIDLRQLSSIKVCVIGKATGNECIKYGIYPDYCPKYYTSEKLIELLENNIDSSSSILICKGKGNTEKWENLEKHFHVDYYDVYENLDLHTTLNIKEKAIVFTCSSAVERTVRNPLSKDILIFSIGPKTSETLEKYGYTNYIQSKQADFASLFECIERNYRICIEQED